MESGNYLTIANSGGIQIKTIIDIGNATVGHLLLTFILINVI